MLRKAVVRTVFLQKELVNKQPFQDLIREVGDFAVDLVSVMAMTRQVTRDYAGYIEEWMSA